jgi:hypothetical protein
MGNNEDKVITKEETVIQREYELNKQSQIFLDNKDKLQHEPHHMLLSIFLILYYIKFL